MKGIGLAMVFFLSLVCNGQELAFSNDGEGKPVYFSRSNYISEGSPYLFTDYRVAEITLLNGKVYPYVNVKLNLMENLVLYKDAAGAEMQAIIPIGQIKFHRFKNEEGEYLGEAVIVGNGAAINTAGAPIYELLAKGKANLLKMLVITYRDDKPYGNAGVVRVFKKTETLFAQMDSKEVKLLKVEKNKAFITKLFAGQEEKIAAYIKENAFKCKSEKDIVEVFSFYNKL